MWRAESPPSFGQSVIGPNTFVASTTFSRRPPPCANQLPMIVSVAPGALVAAVAVRGVEEVDAELERAIHDREGVGLGGLRAEVHRAEAELAHAQRACVRGG